MPDIMGHMSSKIFHFWLVEHSSKSLGDQPGALLADERWEFMFLVSIGFHIAPFSAHISLEEFKILCGFLNEFRLILWTHFDRLATEHALPCPLVLYMHYGSVVSQNFRNVLSKRGYQKWLSLLFQVILFWVWLVYSNTFASWDAVA